MKINFMLNLNGLKHKEKVWMGKGVFHENALA